MERPGLPEALTHRLRSALRERQTLAAGQTAAGCGITEPGGLPPAILICIEAIWASGRLSADKANAPGV